MAVLSLNVYMFVPMCVCTVNYVTIYCNVLAVLRCNSHFTLVSEVPISANSRRWSLRPSTQLRDECMERRSAAATVEYRDDALA
jgi:hypothetical protein